jgi:hypothetical protein
MTRWFHALAAALFALAVWGALGRGPPPSNTDARSQLIALLGRSGLDYAADQPLLGGGDMLGFRLAGCPRTVELAYLPSLSRLPPAALARIGEPGSTATFIHDGEIIGGLGSLELMTRWVWRKLLVAVRLRPSEPWQSIALALLVPRGCSTPPIDWGALTRAADAGG